MTKLQIDEGTARFWTAIFGGITALSLIAAGGYSLFQYWESQKKEIEGRAKDRATLQLQIAATQFAAKQAFANKHLELCAQASGDAGTISATKDPKKRIEAIDDFWRLYWGPLGIVEGVEVERRMVAFGECLGGDCTPALKSLSLDIAHACRKEVEKNFELSLPDVPNRIERSEVKDHK
jgi:hypothetical protein